MTTWEEKQAERARAKAELIDDDDISIINAWDRQQNRESSDKLLMALRKHHRRRVHHADLGHRDYRPSGEHDDANGPSTRGN